MDKMFIKIVETELSNSNTNRKTVKLEDEQQLLPNKMAETDEFNGQFRK